MAFIAVWMGGDMVALPPQDVTHPGVEQTYQIVAKLSAQDTALVAFDYEPGLVGEMDTAAAAVMDNMMEKGTKLVLVSTSPTGPALAERFIHEVQGKHSYQNGEQYLNLGYIPGGISGLAAFAENPTWAVSSKADGAPTWDSEPFQNIQKVSDFGLVLVITDNPNTTRAWVEQVHPNLETVPLVTIVSAQAEPVAHTYQGQIDGIVSGLTGGASYESISGSNLAKERWGAFNILLIVAVSMLIIGSMLTIGLTVIAQKNQGEGDSE
jgi:hypothetical protein